MKIGWLTPPGREEILGGAALRTMFRIGAPAVLSSVLFTLYNLTDAFFIGLLPGGTPQAVMAGIQISWPFVWFLVSFIGGFGGAVVTALVAQNVGANRPEEANLALNQMFTVGVAASVVLGAVGYAFMPSILGGFVHEPSVTLQASLYMRVIFLGLPTMMIPQLLSGALQATGDTLTPLAFTLVGVLINIPLDAMLVLGLWGFPQLGITGAAIATVIAQAVSSAIFLAVFTRGRGCLRLERKLLKVRGEWLGKTFVIGLPAAFGNSSVALGFLVMMVGIGKLDNAVAALSGYGVADRVFGLLFIATGGLGVGLTPMIGQALGAGLHNRTREIARKGMQALFLIVVAEAAFVYVARMPLLRIFIHGDSTGALASLHEGARFIELFAASMPFLSAFFAAQAVYSGSGHNVPSMILGVLRLWVFRIPLSYVFAFVLRMGSTGVWIGMSASNVLSGLVAIGYLAWGRGWQQARITPPVDAEATDAPAEPIPVDPTLVPVVGFASAERKTIWQRLSLRRWFRSS
ncbi:MAG: MATE family efflux transporter [Candidatus Bipolaricaulota bacterium]|nr:MATE family efflux transporter [Candidatus Bipolaricaulota bacterium]